MSLQISRSPHFLPLLALVVAGACDNPVDRGDEHHDEAAGVQVTTMDGAVIATYETGGWTFASGDALILHPGEEQSVRIYFLAEDGDRIQLHPSGAEHTLRVAIANPAVAAYEGLPDHGRFEGLTIGQTTATIQVFHGGHPDFQTNPGLPIEVVAHALDH